MYWRRLACACAAAGSLACEDPKSPLTQSTEVLELAPRRTSDAPAAQGAQARTEQVVHRMSPGRLDAKPLTAAPAQAAPAPEAARSARASNEGITSKHLEAELNRLEAELER